MIWFFTFVYHNVSALSTPTWGYRFSIIIRYLEHFPPPEALGFSRSELVSWIWSVGMISSSSLWLSVSLPFGNRPWVRNTLLPKEIKNHLRSVLHISPYVGLIFLFQDHCLLNCFVCLSVAWLSVFQIP